MQTGVLRGKYRCLHLTLKCIKMDKGVWHQWFTSVILATEEAEVRRMAIQSQWGQIVQETLSQK
jgi:hypothetical protein